jgi:acetoacetate decarboxylase
MKINSVLPNAFSMPVTSPAFPKGPYHFVDQEYLILTYRTDPAKLRALAPVADLPVLEIVEARHLIADLTPGTGERVFDYLDHAQIVAASAPRRVHASSLNFFGSLTKHI